MRTPKKPTICTTRRTASARGRSLPPIRLMTSARLSEPQQISVACQGKGLYASFPRIATPWIMLPVKKAVAANAVCQPRTANQPMGPQALTISSHHRLLRANRRLTCDETNQLHMFGRGKHSCPVVLASGGRGPILIVSRDTLANGQAAYIEANSPRTTKLATVPIQPKM